MKLLPLATAIFMVVSHVAIARPDSILSLPMIPTTNPPQWDDFCRRFPSSCDNATAPAVIKLNPTLFALLKKVNKEVNQNHIWYDEPVDIWNIVPNGGLADCEDMALQKREELVKLGFPRSAMNLGLLIYEGAGHAVMTVETNMGTYILDNAFDNVRLYQNSPSSYRWIFIERHGKPYSWYVFASEL